MRKCQQFRQCIWQAAYNELPLEQKKILEEHITDCPECQLDYEQTTKTVRLFDNKIQLEPTGVQIETSRAELHQRLLLITRPGFQKKWLTKFWRIISLDFAPALRFATAAALLIVGLFLGRIFFSQSNLKIESDQQLLPCLIESDISSIQSIQYDPTTRKVSIKLNTFNDVIVQGNLATPEIQEILLQSLRTEERPDVKLKTVRALQHTKSLNENVIRALSDLIEKEDNPGIRLKAVKLLTTIPITPSIKDVLVQVLVRILLNDSNSAIRIEAFKGLSKFDNGASTSVIFNAARSDSSEYIRTKAKQILERTENPVIKSNK
jgi:hypothetical protein